jgi:hypothetical protein
MSANVEAMVREGINAFKGGRKDEARALLLKATELDQYNEDAWLWLSGLMDTPDDQRTCLENVLAINPNNERASQGLSYITGQTSVGAASSFAASAGAPPAAPSPSSPTSVEWGEPEPSKWAQPAARVEPTPAALDDWVANLNLQGSDVEDAFTFTSNGTTTRGAAAPFEASPFGDFDENDPFGADPFGSVEPLEETLLAPSAPPTKRRSPTPSSSRPPEKRRRTSPAPERADSSLLFDIESSREDEEPESSEPGMFGYIPREIAPTRLPGTIERTSPVLMIGMVLLVVLNVGAALLLMWGLLT